MTIPERPQRINKQREFIKAVNAFPPEAQEVVSGLSSMFVDADVADRVRRDKGEVTEVMGQLISSGLQREQILFVLGHFELKDPTAESE